MSSKGWESTGALCPFYKREEQFKIYCEGVERNSSIQLGFGTPQNKQKHSAKYCGKNWEECIIARALKTKYEK